MADLIYRKLHRSDRDQVIALCEENSIYLEDELIHNITAFDWSNKHDDTIGYGCFDSDRLVGYIGCIQVLRNGYVYNDLSCGIVNPNLRGHGIASKLFAMAEEDGDVILDLTASEQVYQLFKRKFPDFFDLDEYQLWLNSLWLRKEKFGRVLFDKAVLDACSQPDLKRYISENSKYGMRFCKIENGDESCLFGFYTMKKKHVIKTIEITYVSNRGFLANHFEGCIKAICKGSGYAFCFCDQQFVKEKAFKGKVYPRGTNSKEYLRRMLPLLFRKYVKAPNRKFLRINNPSLNFEDYPLDYLYTEMAFYRDLA